MGYCPSGIQVEYVRYGNDRILITYMEFLAVSDFFDTVSLKNLFICFSCFAYRG